MQLALRYNGDDSHDRKAGVLHEEVEFNEDEDKHENDHSRRMTIDDIPDHKTSTHSNR